MTSYTLQLKPIVVTSLATEAGISTDGGWTLSPNQYFTDELGILRTSGQYSDGCIRFENVTIPTDAVINSAVLTCWCYSSNLTLPFETNIKYLNEDNPAAVANFTDFYARDWSASLVSYDFDDDVGGSYPIYTLVTFPDLSSLIQEIVNRSGWSSGNHLTLGWFKTNVNNAYIYATLLGVGGYDGVSLDIQYSASMLAGSGEFIPSNIVTNNIARAGVGQSFNLPLNPIVVPVYYLMTELLENILTEDDLPLEVK
jgi:hypothetical protein